MKHFGDKEWDMRTAHPNPFRAARSSRIVSDEPDLEELTAAMASTTLEREDIEMKPATTDSPADPGEVAAMTAALASATFEEHLKTRV